MTDVKFIVRLLGEMEQYEVSKDVFDELNEHDNKIVGYANDARKLMDNIRNEIAEMQEIARKGDAVEFKKSDFAIPENDITLDDAPELFEGEGLLPG